MTPEPNPTSLDECYDCDPPAIEQPEGGPQAAKCAACGKSIHGILVAICAQCKEGLGS